MKSSLCACVLLATISCTAATCAFAASQDGPEASPRASEEPSKSRAENSADRTAKITVLKEPLLEVVDWKNAGFNTPQATALTFMWALRERNTACIRRCLDSPEKMAPAETAIVGLEDARAAAKGFQALAIRTVDENTVDLKFKIVGWQEKPLVHRLKKIEGVWKIDSSSSTRDASW